MSKNRISKVAIVGAGGQQGKYIVEYLLKTGQHTITALTRADSKNTIPAGVAIKTVNYDEPATLVAALQGQHALVITLAVMSPADTQRKLIEAAAAAKVPWVLPNEWGGDSSDAALVSDMPVGLKRQAERALIEELGASAWLGIACGFWYEFSLAGGPSRYGFDIAKREVAFYNDGLHVLDTSTWDIVGRATAKVLSLPIDKEEGYEGPVIADWRNKYVCVSSFTINQRDMLDSLNRVLGTTDNDWKITHVDPQKIFKDAKEALSKGDWRAGVKVVYCRLFFPGTKTFADGSLANETLGLPKEDLDASTRVAVQMSENEYFSPRTGRF